MYPLNLPHTCGWVIHKFIELVGGKLNWVGGM